MLIDMSANAKLQVSSRLQARPRCPLTLAARVTAWTPRATLVRDQGRLTHTNEDSKAALH